MSVGSRTSEIRGRGRDGVSCNNARAHLWLETQVIKRADAVVLNTPELHREFAQWYGPDISGRFHVVANGYDADILEPYAKVPPSAAPPLILTHAGNLYGARDPDAAARRPGEVSSRRERPEQRHSSQSCG